MDRGSLFSGYSSENRPANQHLQMPTKANKINADKHLKESESFQKISTPPTLGGIKCSSSSLTEGILIS